MDSIVELRPEECEVIKNAMIVVLIVYSSLVLYFFLVDLFFGGELLDGFSEGVFPGVPLLSR